MNARHIGLASASLFAALLCGGPVGAWESESKDQDFTQEEEVSKYEEVTDEDVCAEDVKLDEGYSDQSDQSEIVDQDYGYEGGCRRVRIAPRRQCSRRFGLRVCHLRAGYSRTVCQGRGGPTATPYDDGGYYD